jgi:hypothetical protein
MDPAIIEEIRKDLAIIKGLAENAPQKTIICLVADQVLARLPEPVLAEAEDDVQTKRRKRNEDELEDKPAALEARVKAGEYRLTFGVHKSKPVKELPMDYRRWILGVKQEGRAFKPLPDDKTSWIRNNQMEAVAHVHQYMVWRCWACSEGDTRFKNARLCTSCWHGGGV